MIYTNGGKISITSVNPVCKSFAKYIALDEYPPTEITTVSPKNINYTR